MHSAARYANGFRVNATFKLKLHAALELKMHGLSVIILIVRDLESGKSRDLKNVNLKI